MSRGPIQVTRTLTEQPDPNNTKKSQKRGYQPKEYDSRIINQELDYIHERLNGIQLESGPYTDLESTATTAEIVERINLIVSLLTEAGIAKP